MHIATNERSPAKTDVRGDFPPQVAMILSALETADHYTHNRRETIRQTYRVRATLRLFSDRPDAPPWTLYTRDVGARGIGFVTPHRLPLGHGGTIELISPRAASVSIPCTLIRCRQAAPGWYEGAAYFNRDQPDFIPE